MKRIYEIFAADGELLYVGKSANVDNRLSAHKRWMTEGCYVRISEPLDEIEATILERRAIICGEPRRNKQWTQYRRSSLDDAWLAAPTAALYLIGSEPRHEGWGELIVEGYGVRPIDPGTTDSSGWRSPLRRYRLVDLEQTYRELHANRQRAEAAA